MEETLTKANSENHVTDPGEHKKENARDVVVFIFIAWLLLNALMWMFLPKLLGGYDSIAFKIIRIFIGLLDAIFPLGLAFVVRHRAIKVWMFILGGIFMFFSLLMTIYWTFFQYFNEMLGIYQY